MSVQRTTIKDFADELTRALRMELGRPVVDKTGLSGNFTFTLEWPPRYIPGTMETAHNGGISPGEGSPGGPDIITALRDQLGLKLQMRKHGAVDALVIDSVEKTPAVN